MSNNTITVKALINAPIETVWKKWITPEDIMGWNNANDDWHTPYAENDARTGGKFKSTMAAKDGSFQFDFEGTYDLVEDLKRIEYTMPDGRKVQVVFEAVENQTQVTETFDPEGTNPQEMQQAGWQAILDNFKKYVEAKS